MIVLPVIARELRASARQPFTYLLRVLGVTAALLASVLFGLERGFEPGLGRQLFAALHCTIFGAIWLLVPMLTADCISRERREGTLGLLFMTPLQGTDIVVAKALVHGLRALTLGMAVLPVLALPFLMGGVNWAQAAGAVLLNASAMCWALAAGMLASAWSKSWLRALLLAAILAFAFAFLFVFLTGAGWYLSQTMSARLPSYYELNWDNMLLVGFASITNAKDFLSYVQRMSPASQAGWVFGQVSLCSVLALAVAVSAAGAKIRRSWREQPASPLQLWLRQTFCTPVLWRTFLRRWMRRKLEHNPIGWLEQRTWSGRLVTWGWLAVLASFDSLFLTDRYFFRDASAPHQLIAWLLAGSMAMSAAGSFRRERETGVLELLLVSPLGEREIIAGRLGGLWSQFAPAVSLLLVVWAYCLTFLPHGRDGSAFVFFLATSLTVPVFGLYFSLRCRNFLTAFLSTVAAGLLLPLVLGEVLRTLWVSYVRSDASFSWEMRPSVLAAACQILLAAFCWSRLYHRLRKRAFPLERTGI